MKYSKEIITGIATVGAIVLLFTGVNFLKGNSFFGGDDVYYAYFPSSGGVSGATSVYVDGVEIGKVLEVKYMVKGDSLRKVRMKFNVQLENFKIPKGSIVEAGGIDLFSKGITIKVPSDMSKGYYALGSSIQGTVSTDPISQVKAYADPITQQVQVMMGSVDNLVKQVSSFWDDKGSSEIEASMREVKIAIKKFGEVATEVQGLVGQEKVRLGKIMGNIQSITENLKKSNDEINTIVGNVRVVTDDLVTVDFKSIVGDAQKTLQSVNAVLDAATNGQGTLAKLVNDQALYDELVQTNKDLQNLLTDLQLHPERYIHFSVLGGKTKGVKLTAEEEKKLKGILDKTP